MFACFYSLTSPVAALVAIAETFTPRFEVVGPLVMLDVGGVTRLFGTPREMADQMRRASSGPVRIAIAPTQTAAALLALGRPGVIVIEPDRQREVLAQLPVSVLGAFERLRLTEAPRHDAREHDVREHEAREHDAPKHDAREHEARSTKHGAPSHPRTLAPPHVGEMEDVLPYFHHSLQRATDAAAAPHLAAGAAHLEATTQPAPAGGGWTHPRDAHAAAHTRRPRRAVTAPREMEHPPAFAQKTSGEPQRGVAASGRGSGHAAAISARTIAREQKRNRAQDLAVEALLDTLRRWGVKTLGHLAVLPPGDVYERLGARGVLWQRVARGEDSTPLVPWVPEDPFESSLDLEWPIEGLEPLSFVLGRLFEPLAERLERADRGAAILHTHLRLVDKTVHARTVQLPSPMRDPKTLRTLVLLDLESNPPGAGIDRVRVLIEPTPARVTQWALFERAQPSPEQVSTLLARLTALMGESHVGSPRLVDSWKPGAFEMTAFTTSAPSGVKTTLAPVAPSARHASASARDENSREQQRHLAGRLRQGHGESAEASAKTEAASREGGHGTHTALRRFRLPVPARVQMQEGRPVRITTDRRGVTGGMVLQSAGPWRTSGEWWNDGPAGRSWDRDEWDVALSDGTVYRIFVERDIGQWFLEGVID